MRRSDLCYESRCVSMLFKEVACGILGETIFCGELIWAAFAAAWNSGRLSPRLTLTMLYVFIALCHGCGLSNCGENGLSRCTPIFSMLRYISCETIIESFT